LMMKRGKLFRKSLSNLISHHHHSKNATCAVSRYTRIQIL